EIFKAQILIKKLEEYKHLNVVALNLFKVYGKGAYLADNRKKLLSLGNNMDSIEEKDPYLFHYYYYICNAYNRFWGEARKNVRFIQSNFRYRINMSLEESWRNEFGEIEEFDAIINITRSGVKLAQIPSLREKFPFRLRQSKLKSLKRSQSLKVNLRFFPYGIKAEIVEEELSEP
ncbi:MAG: hypothetical protein AAF694_29025, partial [Bacteroidota bacterium]